MNDSIQCNNCGNGFLFDASDAAFLHKISPVIAGTRLELPPPTFCPSCREQRRLTLRNERIYYRRKCDATGKDMISVYAPGTGLAVYDHAFWKSDGWDPLSYGREYDPARPFFEQFFELHNSVPMPSLDIKTGNENCEYCNLISESRNSYQVVACTAGDECFYSTYLQRNRNVCDCFFIFDSELCYECIDCYQCYQVLYSQFCHSCSDSSYLHNCRSCKHCFACASIANSEYCILNQPVSKTEYAARLAEYRRNPEALTQVLRAWEVLRQNAPEKYYAGVQNESVTGDHLSYCKNITDCYDCTYLEDCAHCVWFHKSKDCRDCYGWGLGGEIGYECHLVGNVFYNVLFSESCWASVSNLLYCRLCLQQCKDLFGCVGLKAKRYCVLNKQYSKAQYEALVLQIADDMQRRGEWGEFFPAVYSPFAYNETVASEYHPLPRSEVESRGMRWSDSLPYTTGKETIAWACVPNSIEQVPDSIAQEVFGCTDCNKNYKITFAELQLYRKLQVPVPRSCFACRHHRRYLARNPRRLHKRGCAACGMSLLSTFSLAMKDKVLCDSCYVKAVY